MRSFSVCGEEDDDDAGLASRDDDDCLSDELKN